MARIPLVQVPNAPAMTAEPAMGGGNRTKLSNLPAKAKGLLGATLDAEDYDGAAEGMARLGKGVQDAAKAALPAVGAVFEHFAKTKERAQDEIALTALQESRTAKFGAFQQERAAQPESGWVDAWRKNDGALRKEIEGAALTPQAREVALADHERFMARSASEIGTEANKQWIERGRATIEGSVRRQFEAGDYAGGLGALHRAQSVGLFSKAEVSAFTERVEGEQRVRMADGFQADDPFGAQAEFQEAMRTGRSALFPWMGVEEIAQRAEASSKAVLRKQREVSGGIDAAILSGQVRDEAGVRRMAVEGRLPESEVASLARSLRPVRLDTQEAVVDNLRAQSVLMTALAETSGPTESGARWNRSSLRQYAREHLTYEQREKFFSEIERQEKGMPDKWADLGDMYEIIDKLVDDGGMGVVKSAEGTINATVALPVYQRAIAWKEAFKVFLKKNPGASSREQHQWLNDQAQPYIVLQGAHILSEAGRARK